MHQRVDDIANGRLKLLSAIRTYKDGLFVAACRCFAGREGVLVTPHGSSHRAFGSHVIDAGDNFLGIGSVGVDVGVDVGVHSGFHNKLSFSSYFRGL